MGRYSIWIFLVCFAAFVAAVGIGGDRLVKYLATAHSAKLQPAAIGFLVAVIVAVLVWAQRAANRQERRRREELARFAATLGLAFEAKTPPDFPDLRRLCPRGLEFLLVSSVVRGRRGGVEVLGFDCIVARRGERWNASRNPIMTAVCVRSSGKNLPWFCLQPDTAHNHLPPALALSGGGVVLDAIPEFSRDFLAHTCDRNLLHQQRPVWRSQAAGRE